jgi:hypothetical protein
MLPRANGLAARCVAANRAEDARCAIGSWRCGGSTKRVSQRVAGAVARVSLRKCGPLDVDRRTEAINKLGMRNETPVYHRLDVVLIV